MASAEKLSQRPLVDSLPNFSYDLYQKCYEDLAYLPTRQRAREAKVVADQQILSVLNGEQEVDDNSYLLHLLAGIDSRSLKAKNSNYTPGDDRFEQIVWQGINDRAAKNPDFLESAAQTLIEYFNNLRYGIRPSTRTGFFLSLTRMLAENMPAGGPASQESSPPSQQLWESVLSQVEDKVKSKRGRPIYNKSEAQPSADNYQERVNNQSIVNLGREKDRRVAEGEYKRTRRKLLFSIGIAEKDTIKLGRLLKAVEEKGAIEYLGCEDHHLKLVNRSLDLIGMVISEMAEAGWQNAGILKKRWDSDDSKQFELTRVIIDIGNELTPRLNEERASRGIDDMLSADLALWSYSDIYEAAQRIGTALFELGERPTDDQLNFETTMKIASLLIQDAHKKQSRIRDIRNASIHGDKTKKGPSTQTDE